MVTDRPSAALVEVLERSKAAGFLGPGPVDDHVDHALLFAAGVAACRPDDRGADRGGLLMADLGAGGGVPALPLLMHEPALQAVLIDASQKRCSFLQWAVVELGLSGRVDVWCGRAERIGHEERARHRFDVVVARGFGPPATTVECGAPLLVSGGVLVISEPPGGRRWPAGALASVGLTEAEPAPGIVVFTRTGDGPADHPRPAKRQQRDPLFDLH